MSTTGPEVHAGCAEQLVQSSARLGAAVDVFVGPQPPAAFRTSLYASDPFECPHGAVHWLKPTDEQVEAWQRDGTP